MVAKREKQSPPGKVLPPGYRLEFKGNVNGKVAKVSATLLDAEGKTKGQDEGKLTDAGERAKVVRRLAEQIHVTPEALAELFEEGWASFWDQVRQHQAGAEAAAAASAAEGSPSPENCLARLPADARHEAEAMLNDPDLLALAKDDVQALGVAGECNLIKFLYLVGVSRLLPEPLAARVKGPSSSGKSYCIDKVGGLFPPEAVVRATQITPQALFYMKPGSLRHKFVVVGERSRGEDDEVAEATRALREMLSAGRISKLVSMKVGGAVETVHIEQEGPIAFVESTTLADVFAEDRNRCVEVYTDEQPAQTQAIVTRLAAVYEGNTAPSNAEAIIQKHHALQWLLESLPVVVPYAGRVGKLVEAKRVEVRRAYPQLMRTIQALALLYQRQRDRDGEGRVVAARSDYAQAELLLRAPLGRLVGCVLSEGAERFLKRLLAWAMDDHREFTAKEAVRREEVARTAVYGWIAELADAGLLDQVTPARGRSPAVWRVNDPTGTASASWLPSEKKVFEE